MHYPKLYNVIVIGAGHAGIEAALASARMGCQTLMLTANLDTIGKMSCNPAIGGPAKSHLVFEIDALGGEMGLATDATNLQLKMLNTSKGPAVWSLRAQSDMYEYQRYMRRVVENENNLDVKQEMVSHFLYHDGKKKQVYGVATQSGVEYLGKCIVMTTGTFMKGLIHIGLQHSEAGRAGDLASNQISDSLRELGVQLGRLKTGTPPRLHKKSIDFSQLKLEPGDEQPFVFSARSKNVKTPNLPCYMAMTTEATHELIRLNLDKSPMYTGKIQGTGPRYCPSIEDKVVKFADKLSHQIFIEPTGAFTQEMYPSGFSTSLPADVQLAAMRTMKGLEHVEFMRPGYAVEYDFVLPHQLKNNFELHDVDGLFCGGQICGTSGYEEAAAQGLYAGINAALKAQDREPLVLTRDSSYIGTMIDDLISKEIAEPYRMFTGRSEFRLILRQDNADLRLTEHGRQVGLVKDEQWQVYQSKVHKLGHHKEILQKMRLNPNATNNQLLSQIQVQIKNTLGLDELLKRPEVTLAKLEELKLIDFSDLDRMTRLCLETEIKYEGFIIRQQEQVLDFQTLERHPIPEHLVFMDIKGLRKEAALKLTALRPQNLGQASRIAGVNPADITVLMINLHKPKKIVSRETI